MLLYVFDVFNILLSGDSLRDLWNAYINACTHESMCVRERERESACVRMYVCMYVCMWVCVCVCACVRVEDDKL